MGDTKEEILDATRAVLAENGFHGLTTQKIAEELDASHSLVHYHFETKEALIAAFLDRYRREFEGLLEGLAELPPEDRLATFFATMAGYADEPSIRALNLAVYELQAYAARNDAYQEPLIAYGETVEGFVVDCIQEGIETGVFQAVDPEPTAALLLSALDGAMLSQFTTGGDEIEQVAFEALPEYVLGDLYADPVPDLRAIAAEVDLEAMTGDPDEGVGE